MSIQHLFEVFLILSSLSSVSRSDSILSQVLLTFRDCWTEVVVGDESVILDISYPTLLSSIARVPYYPLYLTKDANETYKLNYKCTAIVLTSNWKQFILEVRHKILERYDHLSQRGKSGNPWDKKLFRKQDGFVVGFIDEKKEEGSPNKEAFENILVECECRVLEVQLEDTGHYVMRLRGNFGVLKFSKQTINYFPSVSTIQSHIRRNLISLSPNVTKVWVVLATKYLQGFTEFCIEEPPYPSNLIKFINLETSYFNFLVHLINFASTGIYGRVSVKNIYTMNFRLADTTCKGSPPPIWMRVFAGYTSVFMKDVNFKFFQTLLGDSSTDLQALPSSFVNDFNFISCDGWNQERGNSFLIFIKSFDFGLRLTLLAFVFLFLLIGFTFSLKLHSDDSPWLIIYSILLEISPQLSPKLKSSTAFAFILIPYTFTGILISNGYRGDLTSELTAPFPWVGLESFNDVIEKNFSIFGDLKIPPYPSLYLSYLCTPRILPDHSFLCQLLMGSPPFVPGNSSIEIKRNIMFKKISQQMKFPQRNGINCSAEIDRKFIGNIPLIINAELMKCEKSVYAVQSEDLYSKMAEMSGPRKPIYVGKTKEMELFKLNEKSHFFQLVEAHYDSVYIRENLGALNSGGFLFYWESLTNWYNKRKYDAREHKFQRDMATPRPISLFSKLGSIFLIFIAGIGFATLVYLFESSLFYSVKYFRKILIHFTEP